MENQTKIPQSNITEPSLPSVPPQKNNYKILFFVSLGLLLIIGSVLTTLLITQKSLIPTQATNTKETELVTSVPTESIVTPTEPVATSNVPNDWKTYTNATYKLSINYPSTWTVDTNPVDNRVLSISSPEKIKSINNPTPYQEGYSGDDLFINVYKKTLADCKDLETCFNSTGDTVSNIRKIKIGKLDGYLVDEAGMATTPAYFVFSSTNLFKFTSFIKFSETEKQILDTLKFN